MNCESKDSELESRTTISLSCRRKVMSGAPEITYASFSSFEVECVTCDIGDNSRDIVDDGNEPFDFENVAGPKWMLGKASTRLQDAAFKVSFASVTRARATDAVDDAGTLALSAFPVLSDAFEDVELWIATVVPSGWRSTFFLVLLTESKQLLESSNFVNASGGKLMEILLLLLTLMLTVVE